MGNKGKFRDRFKAVGSNVVWGFITGSALWDRIVAGVVGAATAAAGFFGDIPIVFIIPAVLLAAGAVLWVLNLLKARSQFKNLIVEEVPPPLNKPFATPAELAASAVTGRILHARDMVRPGQDAVHNKVFQDCVILGPAVVAPIDNCIFRHANWGIQDPRHLSEIWIEVPKTPRFFYGVIFWRGCIFKDCWFDEIGLVGPAEMIEKWLKAFPKAPPQALPTPQEGSS